MSLKNPITSLTIVSRDTKIKEQISPFFNYIYGELNVAHIFV